MRHLPLAPAPAPARSSAAFRDAGCLSSANAAEDGRGRSPSAAASGQARRAAGRPTPLSPGAPAPSTWRPPASAIISFIIIITLTTTLFISTVIISIGDEVLVAIIIVIAIAIVVVIVIIGSGGGQVGSREAEDEDLHVPHVSAAEEGAHLPLAARLELARQLAAVVPEGRLLARAQQEAEAEQDRATRGEGARSPRGGQLVAVAIITAHRHLRLTGLQLVEPRTQGLVKVR